MATTETTTTPAPLREEAEPQEERLLAAMPKAYDHRPVEAKWYDFWMRQGYFTPRIDWEKEPFCIVIPPPNVTGELHHGHAMFVTFQDLMTRWRRMQGYVTLWLPGTDHAGIATQNVVERELAKEGLTRHDLGREKFLERVWQHKEKYGSIITDQIKRMGASCDWTRERFTLDPGLSRAVREAFVRLYERGLIYRGPRLINWCPRCETVLSDLEVEYTEVAGKFWYIRYPLEDRSGYITIATTRPETMLGDTAVAVHPNDPRYQHLIGRYAILPLLGRRLPIIADEAVDMESGTGALKVTPAHDPVDYEIGQRHNLPAINIMNPDATINENGGPYQGMDRYEARARIEHDLEHQGLLEKVEGHTHAVGHCYRCNTVVEPLISTQWFVKMKPLAEPALKVVLDGRIKFVPERFVKVYQNWMENIQDWCISRQIWWGHRIPVWTCQNCAEIIVAREDPTACPKCGGPVEQDPDVLDTWFSSGLWPFSTLGWPDDTEDLRYFYPTTVMETGYDILFFWVARMIMLGLEMTGDIPFKWVYLHGLMRDEHGQKISKSKGHTADPIEVINRYGADALRYTIITGSSPGNDMRLYEEKLEAARNFANKLWNAARFVLSMPPPTVLPPKKHPLPDRWILSRLAAVTADVTRLMEDFQFGEAGRLVHDFIWDEFCDWYIEVARVRLYRGADEATLALTSQTLRRVLEQSLRLLHPFMPFVTEEVWQRLKQVEGRDGFTGDAPSLIVAKWPAPGPRDEAAERDFALLMEIVRSIRNARAESNVPAARWIEAIAVAGDRAPLLQENLEILENLARARPFTVHATLERRPSQAITLVAGTVEVLLPLAGMVDIAEERARLSKELEEARRDLERSRSLLANENFLTRAKPEVVQREREKLAVHEERVRKLEERLAQLAE